jgi:hypothetical protein
VEAEELMPRYLEIAELKSYRGEAEILRLAGGSEDTLAAAIKRAEAEATTYLLGRYRQSLSTLPGAAPDVLKAKVARMAPGPPSPRKPNRPIRPPGAASSSKWLLRKRARRPSSTEPEKRAAAPPNTIQRRHKLLPRRRNGWRAGTLLLALRRINFPDR